MSFRFIMICEQKPIATVVTELSEFLTRSQEIFTRQVFATACFIEPYIENFIHFLTKLSLPILFPAETKKELTKLSIVFVHLSGKLAKTIQNPVGFLNATSGSFLPILTTESYCEFYESEFLMKKLFNFSLKSSTVFTPLVFTEEVCHSAI